MHSGQYAVVAARRTSKRTKGQILRLLVTRACLLFLTVSSFLGGLRSAAAENATAYITVNANYAERALGHDIAARVMSDEYTGVRKKKLGATLEGVPGLDCGTGWQFGLVGIHRYADLDDQRSWIERYTVQCNKLVKRSLLMVIRGSVLEESSILLPGETIADPVLQMNALGDLAPLALAKASRDCQQHYVFDTAVIEPPSGGSWKERWSFMVCDKAVDVDAAFVPAPGGGTSVIGHVSN